jgi:hypothetical protein
MSELASTPFECPLFAYGTYYRVPRLTQRLRLHEDRFEIWWPRIPKLVYAFRLKNVGVTTLRRRGVNRVVVRSDYGMVDVEFQSATDFEVILAHLKTCGFEELPEQIARRGRRV